MLLLGYLMLSEGGYCGGRWWNFPLPIESSCSTFADWHRARPSFGSYLAWHTRSGLKTDEITLLCMTNNDCRHGQIFLLAKALWARMLSRAFLHSWTVPKGVTRTIVWNVRRRSMATGSSQAFLRCCLSHTSEVTNHDAVLGLHYEALEV